MESYCLEEIMEMVQEEDVEFIRLQFTDLLGNLKNTAVTADQLARVFTNPFPVEGEVLEGKRRKLYLIPDSKTFAILPWRPQTGKVARFLCDIVDENGKPWERSSREILKKTEKKIKQAGYTFVIKPECEFFLFHTDENGLPTNLTHERAGYLDVSPVDLGENARRDMVLGLKDMGLPIESSHHEASAGQHEIDIESAGALEAADRIMTMRMAVRAIAKRHGLHATFMPKPKMDVDGSAMHIQMELWKDGKNVLEDESVRDAFLNGIANRTAEIAVFTNPTVNSYKRVLGIPDMIKQPVVPVTNWKAWKDRAAVEILTPDGTANPYIVLALCMEAGVLGIQEAAEKKTVHFPKNLGDAIHRLKGGNFVKTVLGENVVKIYQTLKEKEWDTYERQVTSWEMEEYLHRM